MKKSGENQKKTSKPNNQEDKDPFKQLKYIAYCRSQLPPDAKVNLDLFVEYAKYQLAKSKNILWKDPVWDRYHEVDILVEYFSLHFDEDKEARQAFEATLEKSKYNEGIDWMDEQILRNKEELELLDEKETATDEGEFDFVPGLGDD